MRKDTDTVLRDLRSANLVYATLGYPVLTEQSLADVAELPGVSLRRINTFAIYGRLNGVQELTAEDRTNLATSARIRRASIERAASEDTALAA